MNKQTNSKPSVNEKQQLEYIRRTIQTTMKKYGHNLTSFTLALFGFYKEQFDLKLLAYLLSNIDNSFTYESADILLRSVGDTKAGIVYLIQLQLFLSVNGKDQRSFDKKVEQFRQLIKEFDPIYCLQSYDLDNDNHLKVEQIDELISYYDIFTSTQKQYIIKQIFGSKTTLSIPEIMRLLHLSQKQTYEHEQPCSLLHLSKAKVQQQTNIKIPEILRGCLNEGFKFNQELLDYLASVVGSGKRFVDMNKPVIKPQHQYIHISQLLKQYFLFEMRTSIVKRDAFRKGHGMFLEARNIRQGHGKDCYILSALSGVVQYYPEHIYNLFLIDKTQVDIYMVKLFIDGEWKLVICDAQFPINSKGKLVYTQPSKHQIWVLLLEKAWAKIFGSYISIQEGSNQQGFIAITGAPCLRFQTNKTEELSQIKHYLSKGYIASVSTNKLQNMSREQQKSMGIYANHAYTLLYIVQNVVDCSTKQTTTLFYLRNPWGRGAWKGNWSFDYCGWTRQLRQQLNYVRNPKDGSFYINLDDFRKFFSKIKVCCINPLYVNSSIRLKSDAKHYVANKFTITSKGDYFLSIYQQNKRKFKISNPQYKMSNANLFVARLKQDKYIEPVGSKATNNSNLSLEVTLQPGQYICVSRVKWNNAPEGEFVLTSYGPRSITFSSVSVKENFLSQFVRLRATDEIGDKSYYGKLGSSNSYKIVFMSKQLGYGYILICNNQEKRTFKGTLTLSQVKGIKMIPPLDYKIEVYIKPQSRQVYPCVVSSNGFQYKILQQMSLC